MPTATLPSPLAPTPLRLRGRVDAHEVGDVDARLTSVAGRDIALDLQDVLFLDGAVLATIERHGRRLAAEGRRLRITGASTAVTVILELAALAGIVRDTGLMATPSMAVAA